MIWISTAERELLSAHGLFPNYLLWLRLQYFIVLPLYLIFFCGGR